MPQPGAVSVILTATSRVPSAFGVIVAVVDEAEVHDVDRDLGVEAGAQLVPDDAVDVVVGRAGRQLGRAQRLLADRVAVGPRDAEQVALDVDREAAAERLRDVADAARPQLDLDAGRNDHRLHVAADDDRLVACVAHAHSVVTGAASPASAALSVCQQRLAHLTRAGNSRTPASAASLPSRAASIAIARQHAVHRAEDLGRLGARLALDRLAHQRGRRRRDRAAAALEAQVADHVAGDVDVEVQPVAAQGIVAIGMMGRRRQLAAVPRAAVVVHDHVAVEVGKVHQRSIRIAWSRASCRASISSRVL